MSQPPRYEPPALPAALPSAALQTQSRWGLIFLGVVGTLLAALLFMPGLPLQWKMYAVVHGICAQEHNIFLANMQFPICARNTGIYISFLLTLAYCFGRGRGRAGQLPHWSVLGVLGLFVVIMGIDGFNSLFTDLGLPTLYMPRNDLRTLTGMGMGITIGVVMLLMLNLALRADLDDQQPPLQHIGDLAAILLLNLLILAVIYANLALFYWPLAFLAFTGITGMLYLIMLMLTALLLGYGGQVTQVQQLARPAVFAFIPTAIVLGSMAALRFWLEAQGLML